jgi:formylmethanofuran dehydrogenase subunit E
MNDLPTLLAASAARHSHLCPRQVLGVRAGLAGLAALSLLPPLRDKRLLVIVETDGCFTDGIEVSTGVAVGHRTLRIEDYGKIAATFVEIPGGEAVRITPRLDIRQRAWDYAPSEDKYYYAQLQAYQVMPEHELFSIKEVELAIPLEKIISRAGTRTECDFCGEEIINEREVHRNGFTLCRACAGPAYYINLTNQQKTNRSAFSTSADTSNIAESENTLP